MKKQIPIGISDYKKVLEGNYYYVDKTLLIKDIIELGGGITLLPRPRRFGKTLNLSMLRYFFEKTETSNQHLFTNTNIWQHEKYQQMQGQYPVIFISFKDVKSISWADAYAKLRTEIAREANRFNTILKKHLEPHEQKKLNSLRFEEASQTDYERSLLWLTELLSKVYNRQAIILLDEYDTPIHAGHHYGYYNEIVSFLRGLLCGAFKDNEFLERGVITGIMRTAKEGIFSGLNNLEVRDVLDKPFADKFGFTQQEVDRMLADYELNNCREQIKLWYDGYRFGNTTDIYNPWSVLHCVKDKGAIETYWANTSDNLVIKELLARADMETKQELEQLLYQKQSNFYELERGVVFPEIHTSRETALRSFLMYAGYLTIADVQIFSDKKPCYALKIPNLEIQDLYKRLLKSAVYDAISDRASQLLEALITGNDDIVEEYLQLFVINSMSFHDIPETEPERSYHLFILGMLVFLEGRYKVQSNRESGLGRYDVMLIPANPTKDAGVIIEFKRKRKRETLEEASHDALKQIVDQQYTAQLKAAGCTTVYQYGIAFDGKLMALVMGKNN